MPRLTTEQEFYAEVSDLFKVLLRERGDLQQYLIRMRLAALHVDEIITRTHIEIDKAISSFQREMETIHAGRK